LAPALSSARVLRPPKSAAIPVKRLEFDETTIPDLQSRMKSGEISAQSLTQAYLARIGDIDDGCLRTACMPEKKTGLNSVLELNPDALNIAHALDLEYKEKGPRGPFHGITVLIMVNIDTDERT